MIGDSQFSVAVFFAVLLITAGCSTSGDFRTVNFAPDKITVENGVFVMSGNISLTGREPSVTYRSVSVILYDSKKNRIKEVEVGNLSLTKKRKQGVESVHITSKEIPKYVVIYSPDFWKTEVRLEVESYEYVNKTRTHQIYYQTGPNDQFPDGDE